MVQEKDNNMNKNSNHNDDEDEWVTAGSRGQHRKQKNFHKGGSSSSSKSGAAAAAAAASSSSSSNKNNNNTNTQHSKTTTPRSHSFRQSSSNNNKGGRGGIISGGGHGHTTKNVQQRSQSFSAAVATSSSSSSLQPYQTRAAGGGGVGNKQHSGGGGGRGGVRRARSYALVSSSSPSSSASAAAAAKDSSNRNTPNNKSNNNRSGGANKPQRTKSKRYSKDVVLLTSTTGSGGDDTENNHSKQQQVIRITADAFLSRRMDFLNIHDDYANKDKDDDVDDDDGANNVIQWKPHERCVWTDADRLEWIERDQKIYFNYKPLSVNEETRWKAKVMKSSTTMTASSSSSSSNNSNDNKGDADVQWQKQQQQEEQIRKATAILNKLSWTTLDKLTVQFLETLGATSSTTTTTTSTVSSSASSASVSSPASSEQQQQQQQQQQSAAVLSKDVVQASMSLVVEKAMDEPHFAELYADFSSKLSSVHKVFRKALLALCQEQFENDETIQKDNTDGAAAAAAAALTPEEKRELLLQKKRSIGLMKFIGELYKLQLIRAEIMVGCLQRLLQDPEDEEKVECYVKLMMTIGGRLHHPNETNHASIDSAELKNLWKDTYSMAGRKYPEGHDDDDNSEGPKAPSNRIKFLLQDLIELKEHDWISQRRQEEKAKTIAEIHKEVAKEEQDAARRSAKFSRSQSFGGRGTKSLLLSRTPPRLTRSSSTDDGVFKTPRPTKQGLSRTKSDTLSPSVSSLQRASMAGSSPASSSLQRKMGMPKMTASNRTPSESLVDSKIVEYLEPKECGKKMKSVLKEYFVEGGDMDYAATTVEELVGMGAEGDVARGAAVVEAGVLLVMEMKEAEVQKFQGLVTRCLDEEKLDSKSLLRGLKDPLEFLRDIELDAPHASSYLADIVASWMKLSALDFDFLLKAPEYFLTDGKPALFAVQVLEKYCAGSGGDRESMISDALVDVVMKLMSEDEKKEASSPREWILSKMT